MNATVDILKEMNRTMPDDPFVCSWHGELFAYISLSAKLNEDTDAGTLHSHHVLILVSHQVNTVTH